MIREKLKEIIGDFSPDKLRDFFRLKNTTFRPYLERLSQYNDEDFTQALFIGEIPFDNGQKLGIYSFRVNRELNERSGKKKQYEKGKKILKDNQVDAGIFIFYDDNNNLRFSLIYTEYLGARRRFSYFKRFTFFVSPRLTNRTFLKQVGDGNFSSFEGIKEAFSVEPVTKEFYFELQDWYFWAMDKVKFPEDYKYSDDTKKDKKLRNATSLIRLITRIIFIWFLKEKGLVPEKLFNKEMLKEIVKDFAKSGSSNYYNAILQNLFFATLNQKTEERKFAIEGDFDANKKEYGVKNLYRYRDKFLISKEEVLELFRDIPFLNGGLFDCLDKENDTEKVIYIDGFSRNPKKQTIIPDYLFFQGNEEGIDSSPYSLGTNKPVRGLIEILKSYNFTVDESSIIDQEIALDPELLGKVFENLLACYTPETTITARKATGSYYTPREIVDYMVEESLYEYLRTHFPEIEEDKIRLLLSYSDETPELSDKEKKRIIKAIDEIKILDPACGSGAFPMGILHRMVNILQKLDPTNNYWRELQFEKAFKASEEVFREPDKDKREEMLKDINEAFDESMNYPDYARKLYLIENCIYGIDIQPIAIQISKLRFFISLILDQKVDKNKDNFGIKPLPNLETKFVSANTLIGLEKPKQISFGIDIIRKEQERLKHFRHKYFTAKTRKQKLDYQREDKRLRQEIAEKLKEAGFPEETAEKIANFDIFDQNASANWFDPEWMFGISVTEPSRFVDNRSEDTSVTSGFDIVIGNPPYVRQEKIKELKPIFQKQGYKVFVSTADLYTYFYEKGYDLLCPEGILCFISSNKWMRAKYGEKLRKFLKENTKVLTLIDFGGYPVFKQTVDTNIILFQKVVEPSRFRDQQSQEASVTKFVNVGKIDGDVIEYI
ncbi:MAG: Eco57I restriction-modification methylase domain-containing protein, partial [bacterium]